jgi:Tol biopolymer transport system component
MESVLEVVDIYSKKIRVIHKTQQHIEAPNWSKGGTYFIVNNKGKLYKIAVGGSAMEVINTGFADACNNDHGISPDGKQLAISYNRNVGDGKTSSAVYTLPINGGTPRLVTELSPSYWHGWSPDGKTLTYCAERNGNYDVYTVPVSGGKETRLTTEEGLDDGPDYSPDGNYIYFNTFRNGSMQIWRMKPDGVSQEQLTKDAYSNWFAHPSPDGKWIVFISYIEDQGQKHPFGKDVKLRLMSLKDKSIHDLTAVFFGGQGTINVPSWSPDSKRLAFISYNVVK